jgi:hypothetical protein
VGTVGRTKLANKRANISTAELARLGKCFIVLSSSSFQSLMAGKRERPNR